MRIKTFKYEKWNKHQIYIFGAGHDGKIIAMELEKKGVTDYLFIDNNLNNQLDNCVQLHEVEKEQNINILLGSAKYMMEMYEEVMAHYKHYNIFTCEDLYISGIRDVHNHILEDVYSFFAYRSEKIKFLANISEKGWYLPHLDVVVTEYCSLKCEGCCSLMPLYNNPKNSKREICLEALDNLFKTNCYIGNVNFIGGEPLINQKLIKELLDRYSKNEHIGAFQIITNGTIVPDDELIAAIDCSNLYFIFSNYGALSRNQEEAVCKLERNNIIAGVEQKSDLNVENNTLWVDYGEVKDWKHEDDVVKKMYDMCMDGKTCTTLINGMLCVCSRIAHAINLGLISKELKGNYVSLLNDDINKYSVDCIRERCKELINQKQYPSGCQYCNKIERVPIERGKQKK
ncbi:MAG: radical SAM protein [Lachnospiraceae bacterium]|nr:radical SAM protein [Lachnospiraceae bacterium]